jgi:hypothetical protein
MVVSYAYKGASETTYGPSATPPTEVGAYTVTATFAATANYNAVSASAGFSITQAPAPAAPAVLTATSGQTLADIAGQLGDWAWDEAGATAVGDAPSAEHPATYTATASYAEGHATVLVVIAPSGDTPQPPGDNTPRLGGAVAIGGSATYGATLTAITSGLTYTPTAPEEGVALTYVWKRGSATVGGNSAAYTLTAADIGAAITVTVSAGGYKGSVPSAAVSVAKAPAPNAPSVAMATYGQTLADIQLPDGWAWDEAGATAVGSVPSAEHPATYEATASYAEGHATVLVVIAPSGDTPQPPGDPQEEGALDFLTYVKIRPSGEMVMNITQLRADSYAPASYRWYKNGAPAGTPSETITGIMTAGSTYYFKIVTTGGDTLRSTSYVYSVATAVGGEGYAPLRVYPNPTVGGQLTIASEQGQAGDVAEVYSLSGVLVATYPIAGELTTIDIAPLPAGAYIVKVGSRAAKVVKQ